MATLPPWAQVLIHALDVLGPIASAWLAIVSRRHMTAAKDAAVGATRQATIATQAVNSLPAPPNLPFFDSDSE